MVDVTIAIGLAAAFDTRWWKVFPALKAANLIFWGKRAIARKMAISFSIAPKAKGEVLTLLRGALRRFKSTMESFPDWFLAEVIEDDRRPDKFHLAAAYELGARLWNPEVETVFNSARRKLREEWNDSQVLPE